MAEKVVAQIIIVFILFSIFIIPPSYARYSGNPPAYSDLAAYPESHYDQVYILFAKSEKATNPHATQTGSTIVSVQGSGEVTIGSSPAGAQVYFDGTYKGLTPLSMKGIPSGQHTLRLALAGYSEYNGGVSVTPGKVSDSVVTLTPGIGDGQFDPGFRWDDPVVLLTVLGIVTTVVGAIVTIVSMVQTKKSDEKSE